MKLNTKTLLFFSTLMGGLVLLLAGISLYSFKQFSLFTAEHHAESVAETIKVALTESMINGTISNRPQFLNRLKDVPGVQNVKILRGDAVVKQFGPGISVERDITPAENQVLQHGEASFTTAEIRGESVFRAIIPYAASHRGSPDCLQCHAVSEGAILGAVSIDIPMSKARQQAMIATAIVSLSVLLAALVTLLLMRKQIRPLIETASAIQEVVNQAVRGGFGGRIKQQTKDEVGDIAASINHLMEFLDECLGTVGRRVGELMGHHPQNSGNQLVATTEMVESLVEVSQFKQAIEEDQNKQDVYRRLSRLVAEKYDFHLFSIYEVASSKNRMTAIAVNGEVNAPCRWCDQQILIDSSHCRVRRTGHAVNAVEYPALCTMFRDSGEGEKHTHICLPITQSGAVGGVVQLVFPVEQGQLANLLIPYITVYLRETAPVLEGKRLMEHLRESSLRDAMTGLYNRRFLEEYVTTLVATSQRRASPFSILMLDLDYFKQVNDTFGHEAGDKVLKTLSEILVKTVRGSDMVVRYGGEEFLIVLLDTAADQAINVAEKIRAKVEDTKIPLPGTILQKTISIGVAEFPSDTDTFWQVVKFADVALYEAKTRGRNRVLRFVPEMWKEPEQY